MARYDIINTETGKVVCAEYDEPGWSGLLLATNRVRKLGLYYGAKFVVKRVER